MRRSLHLAVLFVLLSCNPQGKDTKPSPKPELSGTLVFETVLGNGAKGLAACNVPNGSIVLLSSSWSMADPSSPTLSPNGETLVFQGLEGGKWYLYKYDLTKGETPERLTEGSADSKYPAFDSDGGKLAFSKGGQIALMDMSSGAVRALTFEADSPYREVSFSPDGKTLLYSFMQGTRMQIGRLDVSSLESRTLFRDPDVARTSPVYYSAGKFCFIKQNSGVGSICISSDGKTDFSTVFQSSSSSYSSPAPAESGWIVFSKDAELYAGDPSNGTEYSMREFVPALSECRSQGASCYRPVSVSIVKPEGSDNPPQPGNDDDTSSDQQMPTLKGRLVYHNYSSYEARDSKLWLYDFTTKARTNLSASWTGMRNPMNGHFSPDGRYITFMAEGDATGSWDIYLYDTVSGGQPVNLTPTGSYRDEDPKFSYDGKRIVFKREGHLADMDVENASIRILTPNNEGEYSMPYYSVDGNKVLFSGDENGSTFVACWDLLTSRMQKLYDRAGIREYYPVTLDDSSFYFSAQYSTDNNHDQLYKGYFDGSACTSLAFNHSGADYSDACPVSGGWLIFSSTRSGSVGAYDLFIGHERSGVLFSLNNYSANINSSQNELGASYSPVH